jgi:hypothetical protein
MLGCGVQGWNSIAAWIQDRKWEALVEEEGRRREVKKHSGGGRGEGTGEEKGLKATFDFYQDVSRERSRAC